MKDTDAILEFDTIETADVTEIEIPSYLANVVAKYGQQRFRSHRIAIEKVCEHELTKKVRKGTIICKPVHIFWSIYSTDEDAVAVVIQCVNYCCYILKLCYSFLVSFGCCSNAIDRYVSAY